MSNNKFDALGSDDSEGEGDPGQTLVEVSSWQEVLILIPLFLLVEKGVFWMIHIQICIQINIQILIHSHIHIHIH